MSVSLVSFATPEFEIYQRGLIKSAKRFGINRSFRYTKKDLIKTGFYKKNIEIFKNQRGFGYWLWKPYFILKALNSIKENEIILYADSGCLIIKDPTAIIEIARINSSGLVPFDCWPLTNHQWTKRDTFVNLRCDTEECWYAKNVIATVILIRKNAFTVAFVEEWLRECEKIDSISDDPNIHGKPNIEGFVDHRHDQAVFSLLINKYKIETYRNPSKWGNFLKMKEFRVPGEHVTSPYQIPPDIHDYLDEPYMNSPYGTIFEFNRKAFQPIQPKKINLIADLKFYCKSIIRRGLMKQ